MAKRTIPLTPKKQKRAATLAFLLIAALFLIASLQTQYTPVEFLLNMENFWSFIFVDLLPPKNCRLGNHWHWGAADHLYGHGCQPCIGSDLSGTGLFGL